MESSSQEKTLPATPRRLNKAREDGQVARSKELGNLAVLGGGAAALMALLPLGFDVLRALMAAQLRFDQSSVRQPGQMLERLSQVLSEGLRLYLPLGAFVVVLAVGVALASGSWALSTKPITPDLKKISPLAGIGRLFSRQQLFETAKLTAMTVVVGAVGWQFVKSHIEPFGTLLLRPLDGALGQLGQWMMLGVGMLLTVQLVFALIDFPMQKFLHAHRLRMSREEVKREHKESEGDPHVKGKRRQRQRELAMSNSITRVPAADMVVMNPTHYAVAIRYDDATMSAPRVIAKGADLLALRIRDVAKAAQVPVIQSPMLARALYAHAEIDDEIPSALYTAVAQVLAYVYQLKTALDGRGAMPAAVPVPEVPPELDPHWKKNNDNASENDR